ncbi:MAG: CidA/LrgA family protein [Clostridia bacterium]|nr:CidA/LrgA family protein [Clostridia bacterium]
MKLLRQLLIILAICFLGEILHRFLRIPVPGNVIGMLLLFGCLCTGILKLDTISEITSFLMDHLAFFFIPAGVGLLAYMTILKENWAAIIGISLVTTVLVMVVTGYTVQLSKRGALRKEAVNERTDR